jgi:hypothetical protein
VSQVERLRAVAAAVRRAGDALSEPACLDAAEVIETALGLATPVEVALAAV